MQCHFAATLNIQNLRMMEYNTTPANDSCQKFSISIDQSVLDDLPELDDIDSEYYSESDSDSSASSSSDAEYSYESYSSSSCDSSACSDDDTYGSFLSTINEETEEDLMSLFSLQENDDIESLCEIGTPRSISLGSFLAKNERRRQGMTIDVTAHEAIHRMQELDTDSVPSYQAEPEPCTRKDDSSFRSKPQHESDDCKSTCSSACSSVVSASTSTSFNFKIAQRRLQRNLLARKFLRTLETTRRDSVEDLRSSFNIKDEKKAGAFKQMAQAMLEAPVPNGRREAHEKARSNLINAMSTSAVVLSVSSE